MELRTTAVALGATLADRMASDERVVIVGESVGRGGGLAGSTTGLLDRFGAERVVDVPIADRAAVGLAVGLALGGRRPVVELSATGRLPAALEALAEAASVATTGEFAVPLVVRVPYGGEAGDRVDRDVLDLLASVSGLAVVCASSPAGAVALLDAAMQARGPVVLLEPRRLHGRLVEEAVTPQRLDRAAVVRSGGDVALVSWGLGVEVALEAAAHLAGEGIEARVVDVVSLAPPDVATLGAAARDTGRVVAVHDGETGFAERLLRVALAEAFWSLESPPALAPQQVEAVTFAARASLSL